MSKVESYDYELPPELVAQHPLTDRTAARLLAVDRTTGRLEHRRVRDLAELLRPGDLLVVNDSRVVPARLVGTREKTGGRWEGLFLRVDEAAGAWHLLSRTRGRLQAGERVLVAGREPARPLTLTLVARGDGGEWTAVPDAAEPAEHLLEHFGHVPLPGYIRGGVAAAEDRDRYQTVYARRAGSAAAPTAGLHFTSELLEEIDARGIPRATVTLHVGVGTFRPITASRVDEHVMHTEWCACPPETVAAVAAARARGGRVVAVGTTAARTLESAARSGTLAAWSGQTDLFIRPGFEFRVVDCLITNFHMPRTTLLVLVSAFAGPDVIMAAYAEAIRQGYRFLSYGDAMLLQ